MSGEQDQEFYSGQEAVDRLKDVWNDFRSGEPPIEQVQIVDGKTGPSPAKWEDGVITVPEKLNKINRDYGRFENEVMPQIEASFEKAIQEEVENQREVLRDRFDFLDDFDMKYNGVQVADLDDAGAHLGKKVRRFLDNSGGDNYIVVDFSYFPWIDPIEGVVEGPAERTARHESVHAMQRTVNPAFSELWSQTGSRDIQRASSEGLAKYEEFKETEVDRQAEEVIHNPQQIPEFWRNNVIDSNGKPSDPYSYGELAAYFLEEAHRQERTDRIAEENEEPYPAVHIPSLNRYAETQARKTLIENPDKNDLDRELDRAAEHLGFPFFGNLVESEFQDLKAYLDGEKEYTEGVASPEGSQSLIRVKREEEAAKRALESSAFEIKNLDYSTTDYLRAEARLLAAERLDFKPEEYEKLESSLETAG